MKRTTIKLPDELDARLRVEAERRGITISELTREAIAAHLSTGRTRFAAAGVGDSGISDLANRLDDYLVDTAFGEDAWS